MHLLLHDNDTLLTYQPDSQTWSAPPLRYPEMIMASRMPALRSVRNSHRLIGTLPIRVQDMRTGEACQIPLGFREGVFQTVHGHYAGASLTLHAVNNLVTSGFLKACDIDPANAHGFVATLVENINRERALSGHLHTQYRTPLPKNTDSIWEQTRYRKGPTHLAWRIDDHAPQLRASEPVLTLAVNNAA